MNINIQKVSSKYERLLMALTQVNSRIINYPQNKVSHCCSDLVDTWKNIHHLFISYCCNSIFLTPFFNIQLQINVSDLPSSIPLIFHLEHFVHVLQRFCYHLKYFDVFTSLMIGFFLIGILHQLFLGYYFIYSLQYL